jgi:hypothetical protein
MAAPSDFSVIFETASCLFFSYAFALPSANKSHSQTIRLAYLINTARIGFVAKKEGGHQGFNRIEYGGTIDLVEE